MKRPNSKALKILLKYRYGNPGNPDSVSKEEFEFAKSKGLMFDTKTVLHDDCIAQLFDKKNRKSKDNYVNLFLASLSTNYLDWRCGLPIDAILQTFPKHDFIDKNKNPLVDYSICNICSSHKETKDDFILTNKIRFNLGGIMSNELEQYLFYLREHAKLEDVEPTKEDLAIFSAIMDILINAEESEKAKKEIESKIGKIKGFKSNKGQRKVLLETLGYCSVLETSEHEGLLTKYTNLGLAPRTSINSDWAYPVDFWMGKDGINKGAFKFWFGKYKELEKFWI